MKFHKHKFPKTPRRPVALARLDSQVVFATIGSSLMTWKQRANWLTKKLKVIDELLNEFNPKDPRTDFWEERQSVYTLLQEARAMVAKLSTQEGLEPVSTVTEPEVDTWAAGDPLSLLRALRHLVIDLVEETRVKLTNDDLELLHDVDDLVK